MKKKFKKLMLHPGQYEIYEHPARFKVLVAGRRFGKSRLLLSKIIETATNYTGQYDKASPPVVLLIMPTLKQARAVHWQSLLNILKDDHRVKKIYKSDFRISFKGNKPDILLRGANDNNGDGIRGLKIVFVGVDEMQDIKPIVIDEALFPALMDSPNSEALIIGTPKGKASYFYRLSLRAQLRDDWAYFHKCSQDNPFIPKEALQNARETFPPKVFNQEYMASWESFDGQILTSLSTDNLIDHNKIPTQFDAVYVGVDWGDINPANVVIGRKANYYYLLDVWENDTLGAVEPVVQSSEVFKMVTKYKATYGFADPSQPGKILSLRKAGLKVVGGYNRVLEGNNVVNTLLFQKRFLISRNLVKIYDKLESYHRHSKDGVVLDEVAPAQDDHAIDAIRYVLATLEHKTIDASLNLLPPQNDYDVISGDTLYDVNSLPWSSENDV